MGMYTEWFVRMNLNKDLLDERSKDLLENYINGDGEVEALPEHPLFQTPRWGGMFSGGSYYFEGKSAARFEWDEIGKFWALLIAGVNLKNYDDEIELAFDWLIGMSDTVHSEMVGFMRYEEDDHPTIVYMDENRKPVFIGAHP